MRKHRHGYSEDIAAGIVEKMLRAIRYCHINGVVHRDIKLDNFIYATEGEDAELKLIDFGFACKVSPGHEAMCERLGTLSYMAPELLSATAKNAYNSAVDVWSLGVVTFLLLSGKRPFHDTDRKRKMWLIKHSPLVFEGEVWQRVSSEARDFVASLLQKDPSTRPSPRDALAHPWLERRGQLRASGSCALMLSRSADEIVASLEASRDRLRHLERYVLHRHVDVW